MKKASEKGTYTFSRSRVIDRDQHPINASFERNYPELLSIAKKHLAIQRSRHAMDTVGLVNEAYLKLSKREDIKWDNTNHFVRAVSRTMRHVLVNHIEYWRAHKRGGKAPHTDINEEPGVIHENSSESHISLKMSLEKALHKLGKKNRRYADIIRYRFLQDLSVEETAKRLGVSEATVKRGQTFSKAWLYRELKSESQEW